MQKVGFCSKLFLARPSGQSVRYQEEATEWFRQQRGLQEWVRTQVEKNREPRKRGLQPAMAFRAGSTAG